MSSGLRTATVVNSVPTPSACAAGGELAASTGILVRPTTNAIGPAPGTFFYLCTRGFTVDGVYPVYEAFFPTMDMYALHTNRTPTHARPGLRHHPVCLCDAGPPPPVCRMLPPLVNQIINSTQVTQTVTDDYPAKRAEAIGAAGLACSLLAIAMTAVVAFRTSRRNSAGRPTMFGL